PSHTAPPHRRAAGAVLRRRLDERALEGEAAPDPAGAPLAPAGGLVRVPAVAVESAGPEPVRPGEELSGVVRGNQPERGISAAVDEDLVVHGGDASAGVERERHVHLHRMAPAVRVEDLLARVEDL